MQSNLAGQDMRQEGRAFPILALEKCFMRIKIFSTFVKYFALTAYLIFLYPLAKPILILDYNLMSFCKDLLDEATCQIR